MGAAMLAKKGKEQRASFSHAQQSPRSCVLSVSLLQWQATEVHTAVLRTRCLTDLCVLITFLLFPHRGKGWPEMLLQIGEIGFVQFPLPLFLVLVHGCYLLKSASRHRNLFLHSFPFPPPCLSPSQHPFMTLFCIPLLVPRWETVGGLVWALRILRWQVPKHQLQVDHSWWLFVMCYRLGLSHLASYLLSWNFLQSLLLKLLLCCYRWLRLAHSSKSAREGQAER